MAAALVVAVVMLWRRRESGAAESAGTVTPTAPPRVSDEPMTGLEAALARVTDRDGRPIGEHLDAEAELVDQLRVPDDTGPLLRRALDRVEHVDEPDRTADGEASGTPDAN